MLQDIRWSQNLLQNKVGKTPVDKYYAKKSRNNSEKIAGSDPCDYDQCKNIDQCDIGRITLRDMKKRKCQYGCNGQYDYSRYDIVP